MKLYTAKQRLTPVYGRGIGTFIKDIVTNDAFKNTARQVGRYGLELGKRGITQLTPIAKDLGKQALDIGLQIAKEESGRLATDLTNKGLERLDKKLGKRNTDMLLTGTKTALQKAAESGLTDRVLQNIDKKLNMPASVSSSARDIGSLMAQNIGNATDKRGRVIPNIDEVIKDPQVIKAVAREVFMPKKERNEREPDILSNLLAGTGSKRKSVKKGDGLFVPGKRGNGLYLPGRGAMKGKGIAYV